MIKPCDKGSGIIILNFNDYLEACEKHLSSERTDENHVKYPYYLKTDNSKMNKAKTKIRFLTEQALEDDVINKAEFEAINATKKGPD